MALENEIVTYGFMKEFGEGLFDGFDPDKAYDVMCPGGLHPAWIVGHLAFVANQVVAGFGGSPKVDMEAWGKLFGTGAGVSEDPSAYPAWDTLVGAWRQGHEDVAAALSTATDEALAEPCPYESMRASLPTMREFIGFVVTAHEGVHLGQLSAWRRLQGQPPMF